MTQEIQSRLHPVRLRQRLMWALRCGVFGLLIGSLAALCLGAAKFGFDFAPTNWQAIGLLVGTPILGLLLGLVWHRDWSAAAHAIDAHYGLKDRTATALEFAARDDGSTLHSLQVADAIDHLTSVDAKAVVPLKAPKVLPIAGLALALALVLLLIPSGNTPVDASLSQPLDVVVAQADRAAEELEELEEFAKEHEDPEVEQLVQQLRELIEEMKEPGVDEREALAKLSEMQSAIQQQQSQYNVAQVDAQMKAAGEALALAEETASAGAAMMEGEMEKAAEELEKLESPQLDRKTEKAMKEQLARVATEMQSAGLKALSNAAKNLSEGLGQQKSLKFSEGAKKLAGECRKQGTRKKLTDLLRKQCDCLSECKGACESACRKPGSGKGKGGKNWGLGGTDNELADRTQKLQGQDEQLTGQQSEEGDVEVETIHAPEAEQQAQRSYREAYLKYEKLSESVLDSEPIPLGHRQTIRRYFESIRPQEGELPATDE